MITEIGKIRIKWNIECSETVHEAESIEDRLSNHYRDFLLSGNKTADIEINIQNSLPRLPARASLLSRTRSWNYLKSEDKRYFYFPRGENGSLAEISDNLKTVRFYSPDKSGQLLLYLFPEILYSFILPEFNGILLHACGIEVKNKIFIFMAPTEGGKSTMAKLALKKNLPLLNDDRIILRKIKDKYFAFGNPWHGEVGITSCRSGEIKELFFLEKSKSNYIRKITKRDMFLNIIRNSFYLQEDKGSLKKVVEIVLEMVDNIEGYILRFRPDLNIWRFLDERFR